MYADYAGAPPYAASQLDAALLELRSALHANPHSAAGWGGAAAGAADALRAATLAACRAPRGEYECVLTSGATAALRLVGDAFPWSPGVATDAGGASPNASASRGSRTSSSSDRGGGGAPRSVFMYLRDNHNSVLGVRELAAGAGAACAAVEVAAGGGGDGEGGTFQLVPCSDEAAQALAALQQEQEQQQSGGGGGEGAGRGAEEEEGPQHLFAYPLESNFSGVRYDPGLAAALQQRHAAVLRLPTQQQRECGVHGGDAAAAGLATAAAAAAGAAAGSGQAAALPRGRWRVLVDAAKAAGTSPPDLGACPADFVALSYYKMFGLPTGGWVGG